MVAQGDNLKTVASVARILQKSHPSENPLAHIVTLVREAMKVDVCSLYLLQGHTLSLVATDGLDPSSVGKVKMKVDQGLTGLAVEKRQPVLVREASLHPRFKYFPETGEEKFHSFAAFPLFDREEIVGVLTIQTIESRDFSASDVEMLKVISFQLAGVIYRLVALETIQTRPRSEGHMERLKGIPVAPGFGIGSCFFLTPGVPPVILIPGKGKKEKPATAWKRLKGAIVKTSSDLLRLEKKLMKRLSKQESDIFYSHRMILSDRSFQKKLKLWIDKGHGPIEAVRDVIAEYIHQLESVDDPHFKERAGDLEDIRQRLMEHLIGGSRLKKKEVLEGVLVAETLVPSDTARLDPKRIQAIVTERGGVTSHAAILARSLGIPAVMGVGGITRHTNPGDILIVDGDSGQVILNPRKEIMQEYERIQDRYVDRLVHLQPLVHMPATTKDGYRVIVEANVGLLAGVKSIRDFGAEGIGLYRTEYPFMIRKKLPNEEEQYQIYLQIVNEAGGLPVTFRTLDAGGDKPVAALDGLSTSEANPFLGYRSIRLCLAQPELLIVQLRALLRASAHGKIKVLIPMISGVEEILQVREIFNKVQTELENENTPFDQKVPLGIMIEVPSAVQMAEILIRYVDFFSIGTNDLIQYTLAVDRNNEKVAAFFEPLHPAVLKSIHKVCEVGRQAGKPVGVCGEMAGDPLLTPLLIGLGVSHLSMIPGNVLQVKNMIRQITLAESQKLVEFVLQASTAAQIRERLLPYQKLLASQSN
ncbi:MAG: phosphoenolpyruvate--protein phosphotransferase [Deltaproteobacteria bacterium]|nr:phosphoenolpyruvate--protein phosphotransferase [Deltaproteobacteria bacterium]